MTIYAATIGTYARITDELDCLPPDAESVAAFPNASMAGTAALYLWAGYNVDSDDETEGA